LGVSAPSVGCVRRLGLQWFPTAKHGRALPQPFDRRKAGCGKAYPVKWLASKSRLATTAALT